MIEVNALQSDIIGKLSRNLKPASEEQQANAAVVMLLRKKGQNLNVLFVKRVKNPADPWSGQIGFPGGKREPQDKNLMQAVIRETMEETGIDLLWNCRFVGVMTIQKTKPKPDLRVLPFVVLLEYEPSIRLSQKELQKSFWIPVHQLARNRKTVKLASEKQPACIVGGRAIWGLTYRILEEFFATIELS